MSGRLASTIHRKHRAVARVAFGALCGLACGLLAVLGGTVGAQPNQPTKLENKKLDDKNPIPNDAPGRKAPAEFAVPGADDLKMFRDVEDFKPVAPEDKNPGEYNAWCTVVAHAKKFEATDLERHAGRDLSLIELIRVRGPVDPQDLTKPRPSPYRCDLLRYDGQLIAVRRLEAPKFFTDNPELGVKELYEARLVPVDESPLMHVSIAFLQLPEALAAVRDKPAGEWLDVKDQKKYVSVAGFFFKVMNIPGEQGSTTTGVPLLIGKSVTLLAGHPVPAGSDPTVIEPVRLFSFIKDETELIRVAPTDVQWPEVAAYNRVLIHAHRFSAEELEARAPAVGEIKFADLFLDVRTAYKLKNVKFEGRLIRLKAMGSNADLRAAGIEQVYEGWLVPATEPRGNPVCVVFTEPLAGVEPADRVNKWVSFAGFYFKKMRYESAEEDPERPGKFKHKYAPLLIGKGAIPRRDPDQETPVTWSAFVLWAIAAGVALIACAGLLTWYYRGGDKKAKEAMNNVRGRNPFDAANSANTPPA